MNDAKAMEAGPSEKNVRASILAMDSDAEIRELLRLHLGAAGYDVRLAEDPIDAGHQLLERLPDLLIADISVPYMSGLEFVAALRADPTLPRIPVILLATLEENPERLSWSHGFPMLTKPMVLDELLARVAHELQAHPTAGPGPRIPSTQN